MKFWQKTFILTLTLFLICFAIGIFSVAVFFNEQLNENCENTCLAEQFYIVKSFAADSEYTTVTGGSVSELMMSYYDYYSSEGIILAIEYDGIRHMVNVSDDPTAELMQIAYDTELPVEDDDGTDSRAYFQKRVGDGRYIFIKSRLDGGSITYIKDISYLDEEWESMTYIFAAIAFCVSVILALVLFVMLRRLASPLAKLTESTDAVARGDYSVRAEIGGDNEFSALADRFNNMTERISDQIAALELVAEQKQELVDNLSHEMRTPLTSIHGYAEYLLTAATTEEERIDALMCIMSESERLGKLGQSLLDISYVKNTPLSTTSVRLGDIFRSLEDRFTLQAKTLGCELDIAQTELTVKGDATLIELLLSNLCDNAIKSCRGSEIKKVSICVEDEGERARISVKDTGRGMSAEELRHVTEPFYRTDKARSRADGGAGLGLALCKRIAEAHGGELLFESELGEGTTVTVGFSTVEK